MLVGSKDRLAIESVITAVLPSDLDLKFVIL